MSKTTRKISYSYLLCATLIGTGLWFFTSNPLFAKQAPVLTAPQLGEFTLRGFDKFQGINDSKTGEMTFSLTKVNLTSPRYDFMANSMVLSVKKGLARDGVARGDVHVTVRDLVYDDKIKKIISTQTIHVDCDNAHYVAGEKAGQGRIDLTGNILSKTYTPQFAEPLVLTGQTGSIEFLDKNKTRFTINKGSATVTPIEPTPAPPKKP